jgi:hypothetical protein
MSYALALPELVVSVQAAAFHHQFLNILTGGANSYASAEAINAPQALMNTVNAPAASLLGRSLLWGNGGNGAAGAPGQNRGDCGPA